MKINCVGATDSSKLPGDKFLGRTRRQILACNFMIYFFQGELTRRIKIGFTTRFIRSRLGSLQTGSPDKLIFVGAHPGDIHTERGLHQRFSDSHFHGEWFNETDDLSRYIAACCVHDMDVAHSVDSLVSSGKEVFEEILHLGHEEINARYMAYVVERLK